MPRPASGFRTSGIPRRSGTARAARGPQASPDSMLLPVHVSGGATGGQATSPRSRQTYLTRQTSLTQQTSLPWLTVSLTLKSTFIFGPSACFQQNNGKKYSYFPHIPPKRPPIVKLAVSFTAISRKSPVRRKITVNFTVIDQGSGVTMGGPCVRECPLGPSRSKAGTLASAGTPGRRRKCRQALRCLPALGAPVAARRV